MKNKILVILLILVISPSRLNGKEKENHEKDTTYKSTYYFSLFKKKLKSKSFFVNSHKISEFNYYRSNSPKSIIIFGKDGLRIASASFYNNGQIKSDLHYTNDTLEGFFIEYQNDSFRSILRTGYYLKGKYQGKFMHYYPKNKDTTIQVCSKISTYNDGKLNGLQYYYCANSELLLIEYYDNGEFIGSKSYDCMGKFVGFIKSKKHKDHPFFNSE
jgi:antitoxin component YwqK of YwqJK toxin-antitoxin module